MIKKNKVNSATNRVLFVLSMILISFGNLYANTDSIFIYSSSTTSKKVGDKYQKIGEFSTMTDSAFKVLKDRAKILSDSSKILKDSAEKLICNNCINDIKDIIIYHKTNTPPQKCNCSKYGRDLYIKYLAYSSSAYDLYKGYNKVSINDYKLNNTVFISGSIKIFDIDNNKEVGKKQFEEIYDNNYSSKKIFDDYYKKNELAFNYKFDKIYFEIEYNVYEFYSCQKDKCEIDIILGNKLTEKDSVIKADRSMYKLAPFPNLKLASEEKGIIELSDISLEFDKIELIDSEDNIVLTTKTYKVPPNCKYCSDKIDVSTLSEGNYTVCLFYKGNYAVRYISVDKKNRIKIIKK